MLLPRAFVPTNYTRFSSRLVETEREKKSVLKLMISSSRAFFMATFASETSESLGDLAPECLCTTLIHLLNGVGRAEHD